MPAILRKSPFFEEKTSLRIPDGPAIEIKHHQIILWISLAPAGQLDPPESDHRIPAVLDTGFNATLLLREDHVRDWARLLFVEDDFPCTDKLRVYGQDVPIFDADVWVHPNIPGFRDQLAEVAPFRLEINPGIAVCPASMKQVRLPLLGLSALQQNGLRLFVNGERRSISLRTRLMPQSGTNS